VKRLASSAAPVSRRSFLQWTVAAAAGVSTGVLSARWGAAQVTPPELVRCEPTSSDILGPFYRADAPYQSVVAGPDEPGQRLLIRGRVLRSDCTTPLSGAIVDVWQADETGRYDNSHSRPEPGVYRLRGQMVTNELGEYELHTILPGRYLNGPTYRPRHIHYKVRAEGYSELTTQLYFRGDEYIPVDPWASRAEAGRIVALSSEGGVPLGVFDVVMA
jgi:catechol 1,2-dioxygenase